MDEQHRRAVRRPDLGIGDVEQARLHMVERSKPGRCRDTRARGCGKQHRRGRSGQRLRHEAAAICVLKVSHHIVSSVASGDEQQLAGAPAAFHFSMRARRLGKRIGAAYLDPQLSFDNPLE